MNQKMKVFIIDDHPLFREGVKTIIARDPNFVVCGEAGSIEEGIPLLDSADADIVILDISLPGKNGVQAIKLLKKRFPRIAILILTMHSKIVYITESFHSGAMAYVVKESADDRLLEGLHALASGKTYIDSSVSDMVVSTVFGKYTGELEDALAYSNLTGREQEILRLLAEGFKVKDIAQMLGISQKTVENHRSNVMGKLGLHSAIDLIRYAARIGLIDLDQWKL